jgi:hypothetical protein
MYSRQKRLGCCSSGAVGFGDPAPGTAAAVAALTPPSDVPSFPWAQIFAVSIAAGLVLHHITGKKKRR